MKVVLNKCFGGFSVTEEVLKELKLSCKGYGYLNNDVPVERIILIRNETFNIDDNRNWEAYRAHPDLIKAIEKIGVENAGGACAELEIIEIPDGIEWYISDYDGIETLHEQHRSW